MCVCSQMTHSSDDSQQPSGCTHQHTTRVHACTCVRPCARVCMCGYVYTCMCVYVCMHADDSQQYVCMHADDSQQYVCMHADDSQQPQGLAHHTHSTCDCVLPSTPLQPKPPPPRFCNPDTAKARAVFSRAAVSDICVAVFYRVLQSVSGCQAQSLHSLEIRKMGSFAAKMGSLPKKAIWGKGVCTWETLAQTLA